MSNKNTSNGNTNIGSNDYDAQIQDFFNSPTEEKKIKIINFLKQRFMDLRTLDVITLKGNYDLTTTENTDFFEELKKNHSIVRVFAKTHIQIDGDTLNVIPYESPGDSAYKEIMEFHNTTVNSAREQWTNRVKMYHDFINSVIVLLEGIRKQK